MHSNLVIKILISPFALIFRIISVVRNKMFDLRILSEKQFSMPVIGIGNITVGGTGKTPHIEYLINLLNNKYKLAVLSRGYKRNTHGFMESDYSSTSLSIGDEPMQMRKKFEKDLIIAVSEDRVKGIKKLREKHPELEVILLDDSYQHRYVKPGMNILLVDYNRPIFSDHFLPLGELRESGYNYDRANIVIITKCPDDIKPIDRRIFLKDLKLYPYQKAYFTSFEYGNLVSLERSTEIEIENIADYSVVLVTGIARPENLIKHLDSKVKEVVHFKFKDHYKFKDADIEEIKTKFDSIKSKNKIIITTEKDAVRLMDINNYKSHIEHTYQIPIKVKFLEEDQENFNHQIINYVKEDKRNSSIHSI